MTIQDAAVGEARNAGQLPRVNASTPRSAWIVMPFGWGEKSRWHGRSIAKYQTIFGFTRFLPARFFATISTSLVGSLGPKC